MSSNVPYPGLVRNLAKAHVINLKRMVEVEADRQNKTLPVGYDKDTDYMITFLVYSYYVNSPAHFRNMLSVVLNKKYYRQSITAIKEDIHSMLRGCGKAAIFLERMVTIDIKDLLITMAFLIDVIRQEYRKSLVDTHVGPCSGLKLAETDELTQFLDILTGLATYGLHDLPDGPFLGKVLKASDDRGFAFFPKLPLELKFMIWNEGTEGRVIEVREQDGYLASSCLPPPIFRTTKESRQFALREYIQIGNHEKGNAIYIHPKYDTVLLGPRSALFCKKGVSTGFQEWFLNAVARKGLHDKQEVFKGQDFCNQIRHIALSNTLFTANKLFNLRNFPNLQTVSFVKGLSITFESHTIKLIKYEMVGKVAVKYMKDVKMGIKNADAGMVGNTFKLDSNSGALVAYERKKDVEIETVNAVYYKDELHAEAFGVGKE